ncbi:plasmid pRiA4b ORF-3 family protein [Chroococcidiopsis sp. CCMEE 29]|uniref:plasmid pRiA4b ORF-3 family protein n=1 Tax=Chroococcidiopsis sp. CCMEE 29 TaxID=155894 RepID=UPI0020221C3F|nr:plasmid pRiA4b ORF-3 family protein [Chroococcidiopsis sp. CCMEE 29]
MTVNLNRIDSIKDYDEAIEALEEYVGEMVDEFTQSPEGKAYLKAHPEMEEYVGSWIDNLLYFGYAYESVTLPHMTKNHVEVIVTRLFPNKVSLLNPDEADTTIPELISFWQFLKREYKHPNATKILKFLEKIQPKFKGIMNDPSKFGMAKSFFTAGTAAGFDMTNEEGLKAFQEQYNQNIRESTANSPVPPGFGMLLSNVNLQRENPPEATPQPAELQDLLNSLASAIAQNSSPSPESPSDSINNFSQQLRASMWQSVAEELQSLSEEAIALLKQQTITETEPGTILQDFQTLLDFVGNAGIAVSGTQHLLPLKSLADLNQRLSEPIQTDLKRPQQKSYPPINGLYLLLRASGVGQIVSQGKKHLLVLNPELLQSWNSLNPTERYFTLLEAWLIRAHEEMVGERRSSLNEGTKCIQYWPRIPDKGQKIRSYAEQQSLSYWPELHNLALMKLFGLLHVESGKPEAGKGWRVKTVKQLPFGDALMQVIVRAFVEHGMEWGSEENSSVSFGELQPALQPYFPEWQNTLAIPEHEFRSGVYVFKLYFGKIWRRIAISSQMTLADLSSLILESVNFDSDHLDMFTYKNQIGRTVEISHPYADGSPSTTEVCIGDLPLSEGAAMTYVFDFGDWWEFNVQLEKIQSDDSRVNYGAIIESYGAVPPQYPDWDDTDND